MSKKPTLKPMVIRKKVKPRAQFIFLCSSPEGEDVTYGFLCEKTNTLHWLSVESSRILDRMLTDIENGTVASRDTGLDFSDYASAEGGE